jgi:cytochrome c oxidase assembly factor CtaG
LWWRNVDDRLDASRQWEEEMTALLRMIAATATLSLSSAALAASPSPVGANHGMVVSGQHLASQVGAEIMKQGGNAVDAAVASAMRWRWFIRQQETSAAAAS